MTRVRIADEPDSCPHGVAWFDWCLLCDDDRPAFEPGPQLDHKQAMKRRVPHVEARAGDRARSVGRGA